MPKPVGCTAKGQLIHWLRHNPGMYRARKLALQHKVSRSVVSAALAELEANGMAVRQMNGRNTRWVIRTHVFVDDQEAS